LVVTGISATEFSRDFWASFQHEAWRLELLDEYDLLQTRLRLARFLSGEPVDPADRADWLSHLQVARREGRRVGRVHVIGELTDYLRYELACYEQSAEAGEDIRILPAAAAAGLSLPDFDYWLLDGTTVALMHYGERGVWLSTEIITEPGVVARCVRARDEAMSNAIPLNEYLTRSAA
jgi:hypothetical protein